MKGTRVDVRMVELQLASGRERAKSMIMAGIVSYEGKRIDKPSETVPEDAILTVKENLIPYVSRGGLKLEKAIKAFELTLAGKTVADVGASTGGFTDCMLQNGAVKVFAIDVGYGQLDWRLRNDPRVVVMERRNARNIEPAWFDCGIEFASMDISFISVKLILRPLFDCLLPGAKVVVLVKPQFEAGREKVGKNGIVREIETHIDVVTTVINFSQQLGYTVAGLDFSPITGAKGNIEFLLCLEKPEEAPNVIPDLTDMIKNTCIYAHKQHGC